MRYGTKIFSILCIVSGFVACTTQRSHITRNYCQDTDFEVISIDGTLSFDVSIEPDTAVDRQITLVQSWPEDITTISLVNAYIDDQSYSFALPTISLSWTQSGEEMNFTLDPKAPSINKGSNFI